MKARETLMLALVGAALSLTLGCSQEDAPRRTLGGGTADNSRAPVATQEEEPPLPGAADQQQAYVPPPPPQAAPAAGPVEFTTGNDRLLGDLNNVGGTLQAGDYESAVNSLAAIGLVPMTPEQEQAYRVRLFEAQTMLLQRADRDPKARQAYENLGRKMTGR